MTSQTKTPKAQTRNLRDELIDAGIELLESRGPDRLSLRECAAKAGVSHAAPTYHFQNIAGLATAIAARGYRLFADEMDKARRSAPAEARPQLEAICHGYFAFARSHRALFLFIFSAQNINRMDLDFKREADRAYEILRETCAPFAPAGTPAREIELLVWSLVHGYSHLALIDKDKPTHIGSSMPPLDLLLRHIDLKN